MHPFPLPLVSFGRRGLASAMILVACLAGSVPSGSALAQAFCELRDPVEQIYMLLPRATDHRSIVRSVDGASREATSSALPFSIHFNELGRHTLYVGMAKTTPIGLVHVRSEAGRWGLVEIAWAMDLNLRIENFSFQRCRDNARRSVSSPAIADQIRGRSFAELRDMLSADGTTLSGRGLTLPPGTRPEVRSLVVTLLRSALKTQVVTHTTWNSDLQTMRWIARGHEAFEGAAGVERIDEPWAASGIEATLEQSVGSGSSLVRDGSVLLRVRDAEQRVLGLVLCTPWKMDGQEARVWWTIGPDAHLLKVDAGEPGGEVHAAFKALEGFGPSNLHRCSTAVELAGKEAVLLAARHLGGASGLQQAAMSAATSPELIP